MKLKATTLSVITDSCDSVHCGIEVDGHYTNVTLRFDREKLTICGYPMNWGLHDEHVEHFNCDSLTYSEHLECTGELPEDVIVYVDAETEEKLLKRLKTSIERQFKDKSWKGYVKAKRKQQILKMFK